MVVKLSLASDNTTDQIIIQFLVFFQTFNLKVNISHFRHWSQNGIL